MAWITSSQFHCTMKRLAQCNRTENGNNIDKESGEARPDLTSERDPMPSRTTPEIPLSWPFEWQDCLAPHQMGRGTEDVQARSLVEDCCPLRTRSDFSFGSWAGRWVDI
jgi:hypothetical protein